MKESNMSKTIAINAGSSSLKWQLYQMPEETVIAKGIVERIGLKDSIFTIKYGEDQKFEQVLDIDDHEVAVKMLLDQLIELNILSSYDEITGVGHRVVHGGETYGDSVVVDEEVMERIQELAEFAPLHNPANLMGIKAFKKILPNIISVAVFDTSFHSTMPKHSYLYSLPMEYYEDLKVRKYGFHGTSHRYVSERAADLMGKPIEELKIITCHLGNGVSITAVDGGKSVDTSMGFTPLAGVTMGTRSGDIDPAVLPYLMEKLNIDIDEMINILNKKSGLLGLTHLSSDMRDLEANYDKDEIKLAYDIFVDRIRKYIGGYVTTMNGVDAIVFTAGIGENDGHVRSEIIKGMTWFGCALDPEKNKQRGQELAISTEDSKVKVFVIPTDEELMIARDVERLRG
jgi:acetate kinase